MKQAAKAAHPVAKKSAKKAAGRAAKKATKKAPAKHVGSSAGNDMRRAYEHFGRIQALASITSAQSEEAQTLIAYAEAALRTDQPKNAAEILRAAEHILFGTLQESVPADPSISPQLLATLHEDYEHMLHKAEAHGACADAPPAIRSIFRNMQKRAAAALKAHSYRAAMELARGAAALAHADFVLALPTGNKTHALR